MSSSSWAALSVLRTSSPFSILSISAMLVAMAPTSSIRFCSSPALDSPRPSIFCRPLTSEACLRARFARISFWASEFAPHRCSSSPSWRRKDGGGFFSTVVRSLRLDVPSLATESAEVGPVGATLGESKLAIGVFTCICFGFNFNFFCASMVLISLSTSAAVADWSPLRHVSASSKSIAVSPLESWRSALHPDWMRTCTQGVDLAMTLVCRGESRCGLCVSFSSEGTLAMR
mmetsp:Transcript_13952/g.35127  ORF Transcript_13952/g.35127 Transcript_13952/m.35127 type:complete len:231 (-) Transcript_13952:421-1113(-)